MCIWQECFLHVLVYFCNTDIYDFPGILDFVPICLIHTLYMQTVNIMFAPEATYTDHIRIRDRRHMSLVAVLQSRIYLCIMCVMCVVCLSALIKNTQIRVYIDPCYVNIHNSRRPSRVRTRFCPSRQPHKNWEISSYSIHTLCTPKTPHI